MLMAYRGKRQAIERNRYRKSNPGPDPARPSETAQAANRGGASGDRHGGHHLSQRSSVVPDYQTIAIALSQHTEAVAVALLGNPVSRTRHEWRWGDSGNPSFKVMMSGPYRGRFTDFVRHTKGSQDGGHGDLIGLAAAVRFGGDQRAAAAWARAFLNLPEGSNLPTIVRCPSAPPQKARATSGTATIAARIWGDGVAPEGTPVEAYLASRGLRLEPGLPIRFHSQCRRGDERLPAMLALMTDPASGEPCGVHRTFLAHDGSGKAPGQARAMLGVAGVVRLVPDAEITTGLGLAEGIETGLSAMQGMGWRPVWSATSASGIRSFPILHGIEALTLFADGDAAGQDAAEACADRWAEAGREASVMTPPDGLDLNDIHRGMAA